MRGKQINNYNETSSGRLEERPGASDEGFGDGRSGTLGSVQVLAVCECTCIVSNTVTRVHALLLCHGTLPRAYHYKCIPVLPYGTCTCTCIVPIDPVTLS